MITPLSRSTGCLVEKYINSDFDHVVNVAEHMDQIKNVEANQANIDNVSDHMTQVVNVSNNMEHVVAVSTDMETVKAVHADEVDIGKVADNITEVVQVANGMEEYQVIEHYTLEQGQTTVQLDNILAQTAKVEVMGQMVDGTVLLRNTDFTVTAIKRIDLTRSYPKGTIIKITQVVYKNQDDPYIVIDELSAFNRKTVAIGVEADISPYEDAGRMVNPRLLVKSISYVNIEPIPANTLITSVNVTSEPDGVIIVRTSNGDIRFSSVLAEAFTREEIGKTATITHPYYAVGGESTITVPYLFDNVQAVYINGLKQVRDYSWEWAKEDGQVITIAEELLNGDLVEVIIGGEYEQLLPPDIDLSDVYGVPVFDLVNGLVITPTNNQYPKLAAFGAIYELADNSVSYTVKSFAQSVDGDCVITLSDDSMLIARKVDAASKEWTKSVTQQTSKDYISNATDKIKRLLDLNSITETEKITPSGHYILDGQFSTLKLKDNIQLPVFYDNNLGGNLFECKRMTIDANMQNNHDVNKSSGVFWLKGWNRVRIFDVDVVNAYRNVVNLYSCRNVVLSNYTVKNCGLKDTAFGGFTYGATFEKSSCNIDVTNFEMKDCYGFGIHVLESSNAHLKNIDIQRVTCNGNAIGITLTASQKIVIDNFTAVNVDGTCLEINACSDVEVSNFNLSSTTKRALLFGDNNRGINNKRIKLSNGSIQSLATSTCCAINFVESAEFNNVTFWKPIDILPEEDARARDILFINSHFKFPINSNMAINPRFKYVMCDFEDIQIISADETRTVFSSVNGNTELAQNEYIDIPLVGLRNINRGVIADVNAVSSYKVSPINQTGIVEFRVKFDMDNNGTISIVEQNREGTQFPKYLTASVATNANNEKVIRLTNANSEAVIGSFSGIIY